MKALSVFWLVSTFFLVHLMLYTVVVPERALLNLLARERAANYQLMGESNGRYAEDRATHYFTRFFVDTGVQQSTFTLFMPKTKPQDTAPTGTAIDNVEASAFPWVESRLRAFWTGGFLIISRLSAAFLWLPFVLMIFLPFFIDAMAARKIKASSFATPSPHMQGLATRSAPILILLYLILVFVPIYLSPIWVPFLLLVTSALSWVMVSHFVKRG